MNMKHALKNKHMKLIISLLCIISACNSPGDVLPINNNDKVEYTQYGVPFKDVPNLEDAVVYEVNMRSFSASGDFQGVIDRLDEIKKLGVNVIWLMPIYPVGQLNSAGGLGSPYSVRNYKGVNPEFGDLAIIRELIEKAHSKGMAVILDWVANHTSWDNPWITNKSWYTQDNSGNIISPPGTNWTDVADLNFNNSTMCDSMISSMKYWILEANADGFRCDAADFVPATFWTQALNELKNIDGRKIILLAEGGKADNFTAGFQMNYAWDFYTAIKNVFKSGGNANLIFQANINEYNTPGSVEKLRYITNHDIYAWDETPTSAFISAEGSEAAFVITSYLNGIPLIYAGQEIAYPNAISIFDKNPLNWTLNNQILLDYQKIMQFRNSSPTVKKGQLTTYDNLDVIAFKKVLLTDEVLIIANVRNSTINYLVPAEFKNSAWQNALTNQQFDIVESISLAPFGFLILKK